MQSTVYRIRGNISRKLISRIFKENLKNTLSMKNPSKNGIYHWKKRVLNRGSINVTTYFKRYSIPWNIREIQTLLRFYLTCPEWQQMLARLWEKQKPYSLLVRVWVLRNTKEISVDFSLKTSNTRITIRTRHTMAGDILQTL